MNLANIFAEHGLTNHTFLDTAYSTSAKKAPRDVLLKLIDNSLKLFDNPEFKVKNAKGKDATPDVCFRIDGDEACVWLSYAKERLLLEGGRKILKVPKHLVVNYLNALKSAAEKGVFDAQLEEIRAKRLEARTKGDAESA